MSAGEKRVEEPTYGYDIRLAAPAYAGVMGSVAGFVVTAVVVVFTVTPPHVHPAKLIGLATGLLVLGLIGCLVGAFTIAALSGERRLTANLPASALYSGAAAAVGFVAVISAFEVLATVYLPSSKSLFAMITGASAFVACFFVAMGVGDAYAAGATQPQPHKTPWIKTQRQGYRWGLVLSVASSVPILVGIGLYAAGVHAELSTTAVHVLVGVGVIFTVVAGIAALVRTFHADDGLDEALRIWEPMLLLSFMSAYLCALIVCLP